MGRVCIALGVAGALVLAGAGFAAFVVARGGISARTEPSATEARIARTLRAWATPSSARDARNPVPAGAQAIAAGLAHFADHCASCHANDGSGRTALGRGLHPRAPDLRAASTQGWTDGQLFHFIEEGIRFTGMPAWGGKGTAEGSWQLVHFIRHLPALTARELVRMEALNPKSPAEWRELEQEDAFLRGGSPPGEKGAHGGHAH